MDKTPLIRLKNVSKFYYNKGVIASGFNKINLNFNIGEFVVITGESGSGKSTLLNVISGLDTYEEGELYINGKETSHYSSSDFENYRKTYIGSIFQNFNLVNSYTVYQNIELVLLLNGYKNKNIKSKIIELIKKVDLYKYRNTRVSHLSGGQKQRVAIARTLAKDTPIIIADEPTGNLDSKSAASVLKLLSEIAKDKLVIIVTHNYDQVEKYATRKIEMSDGKVREDIILKETSIKDINTCEYGDIRFFSKLRIGIRNTFNIFPKFALLFLVFLFICAAFTSAYAGFKSAEAQDSMMGYNSFFNNHSEKRIVVNKKDKTSFTDEELDNLSKLNNVESLEKNDLLLDSAYNITDDNFNIYAYGKIESVSNVDKVDMGRLPENDNEVVAYLDSYYYSYNSMEDIASYKCHLYSDYGITIADNLSIVGVIYSDNSVDESVIYVTDSILDKVNKYVNQNGSTTTVEINNIEYDNIVVPLDKLSKGEAIVSDQDNYKCTYNWCKNKDLTIKVKNLYYEDSLDLKIVNVYYKSTFDSMIGLSTYDESYNTIYISYEDFNYLYNKDTYQISLFVDDVRNVESVQEYLTNNNYNSLSLKSAKNDDFKDTIAIIKIFKVIVLTILFIGLFFITYFVIKLIQKSKNVYYSTVRILGGSKKVINSFIKIELFTVYNLTYLLFIVLVILVKQNIIDIQYIKDLSSYLMIKDYVIMYVIMFVMSYLIAVRYSRKLFTSSAMKSYREEI